MTVGVFSLVRTLGTKKAGRFSVPPCDAEGSGLNDDRLPHHHETPATMKSSATVVLATAVAHVAVRAAMCSMEEAAVSVIATRAAIEAMVIPACKVTRFRSASSHVSLETQSSSSNSPLKSALQLLLAGRNTADGVRNFVFGSSVATWTRSNRPLLFPLPLPPSNVRRYWLLRCIWISSKYGLRLTGSPKPR